MGAPRHVLEGASAIEMDSAAQVYVIAPVRLRGDNCNVFRKDTFLNHMHNNMDYIQRSHYITNNSLYFRETFSIQFLQVNFLSHDSLDLVYVVTELVKYYFSK